MRYLRQNTDQYVTIGPLVDKTDFLTTKDDATVTNLTYLLSISTHAGASTHVTGTCSATAANDYGCVAIGHNGMYDIKLPDADLNFVGSCTLAITYPTAYLPVWHEFQVIPANVWDSLHGTDLLDVNQAQVLGTAVHASSEAGTQCVEVVRWGGADVPATGINGTPVVDMVAIHGTALTETATQLAGAFTKFFNVAAPTGTVNSLPDAVAGANGGLTICGSNAATTFATLSVTGQLDAGNLLVDTTTVLTGNVTLSGTLGTGAVTLSALTVTNNALVSGTTTLTGNVTITGTLGTGAVTLSALTVTNNLLISGTSTSTGAVTLTGGIAAGAISGTLANDFITAASINTGAFSADAFAADAIVAATLATGAITADAFAADSIEAAAIKADAVTKIQAGLATPTNITSATGVVLLRPAGAVVADGSNSTTNFKTGLASAEDDYIKDAYLKFTSGANVNQVKRVSAYNGTTKFVTTGAFTDIPAEADAFVIINE